MRPRESKPPHSARDIISQSASWRCSESAAVAPAVGVVLLVGLTLVAATMIAVGLSSMTLGQPPPTASFDLEAQGDGGLVTVEHRGGDPIDVTSMALTVAVDGEALDHQPPVPFVGAEGFRQTPDGPFNEEGDTILRTGEEGTVRVAETNDPAIESGRTVTVTISVDGHRTATLETVAE